MKLPIAGAEISAELPCGCRAWVHSDEMHVQACTPAHQATMEGAARRLAAAEAIEIVETP